MGVPKNVHWAAFEDAGKVPPSRQGRAYELFKDGLDTFDIGKRLGVHESVVCQWIDRERNIQRKENSN